VESELQRLAELEAEMIAGLEGTTRGEQPSSSHKRGGHVSVELATVGVPHRECGTRKIIRRVLPCRAKDAHALH